MYLNLNTDTILQLYANDITYKRCKQSSYAYSVIVYQETEQQQLKS